MADGKFHSNNEIMEKIGINIRTLYKYVKFIEYLGLEIIYKNPHGYSLSSSIQLLDRDIITAQLNEGTIEVVPLINSTNQYLLEKINQLKSGDACIGEYQQTGRGRYGRTWYSPFGYNIYLSLYWCLKHQLHKPRIMGLTVVVAIIIAEVLLELGIQGVGVKWPNDIYLKDRKLAGILIDIPKYASIELPIIIGIGINIRMSLSQIVPINTKWIDLHTLGINIDRNHLTAKLINKLLIALRDFEKYGFAPFIKRWFNLDCYLNRPVKLLVGHQEILGIARGINYQGGLLLETNHTIRSWFLGDISLQLN